jgi:PAS domain S-box-containing protein
MDNARHHQAVMLQQKRLSQIFDATSDGMLLVAPDGRVETANRRAGDLLRFKASDLVGNELTEVLAWHRAEGTDYRCGGLLREGEPLPPGSGQARGGAGGGARLTPEDR